MTTNKTKPKAALASGVEFGQGRGHGRDFTEQEVAVGRSRLTCVVALDDRLNQEVV